MSEESRTNLDFAYRYLLDGDGAAALQKAALCPEEDSEIITLLADAVKRDYVSTYFEANRLLKEAALKPETETRVREIRSLAAGALGLSISEDTGELVTGGENLPLVGITQEASAPTMTEAERGARVEQLVYEICDEQGAADVMDSRTDELYKLDKALTQEDLPIVLEQYEQLAQLMLQRRREGRPFTFYHYMIDLKGGPCIYKRISGCGSGTEYMAVTPWGDLYPCHQFVGEEKFKLGNVWDGVTNTACQAEFAACNVYAHPECADCWAKLYCSGGCAANAYHATGSVTGVYSYGCELFRKRMECAIMVEAVKALEGNG